MSRSLLKLYPETENVTLEGLYLGHHLRDLRRADRSFVYANFLSSLDGRIALSERDGGDPEFPVQIGNKADTRLFLELAAPADAVIVSGQYMKNISNSVVSTPPPLEGDEVPEDILAFRQQLGLSPQPTLVVVSNHLDFANSLFTSKTTRKVIVATTDKVSDDFVLSLENENIDVLKLGDDRVDGRRLISELAKHDIRLIYSVAGPKVMATLLEARVVDRLYLTTALRLLSGTSFSTLCEGAVLSPPYDFQLSELYLDQDGAQGAPQLMSVLDRM